MILKLKNKIRKYNNNNNNKFMNIKITIFDLAGSERKHDKYDKLNATRIN